MLIKFLHEHGYKYEEVKGMTELSAAACTSRQGANAIGCVGIPFICNAIKIVDLDTGIELPYDQTGEIQVSGPFGMLVCYNSPLATEEIIVKDTDDMHRGKAGDFGRISQDRFIFSAVLQRQSSHHNYLFSRFSPAQAKNIAEKVKNLFCS